MLEPLYKEGKFITKSPVSVQNLSGEDIESIELFIMALHIESDLDESHFFQLEPDLYSGTQVLTPRV